MTPYVLWISGNRSVNVHRNDVCRLCFTIGPFAFRWHR